MNTPPQSKWFRDAPDDNLLLWCWQEHHNKRSQLLRAQVIIPINNYSSFLSDEGPMLETLDYTIRIGSTPTILYFDFYLYSAYAAHYVYSNK